MQVEIEVKVAAQEKRAPYHLPQSLSQALAAMMTASVMYVAMAAVATEASCGEGRG